jgi:hypothetical protein
MSVNFVHWGTKSDLLEQSFPFCFLSIIVVWFSSTAWCSRTRGARRSKHASQLDLPKGKVRVSRQGCMKPSRWSAWHWISFVGCTLHRSIGCRDSSMSSHSKSRLCARTRTANACRSFSRGMENWCGDLTYFPWRTTVLRHIRTLN